MVTVLKAVQPEALTVQGKTRLAAAGSAAGSALTAAGRLQLAGIEACFGMSARLHSARRCGQTVSAGIAAHPPAAYEPTFWRRPYSLASCAMQGGGLRKCLHC